LRHRDTMSLADLP